MDKGDNIWKRKRRKKIDPERRETEREKVGNIRRRNRGKRLDPVSSTVRYGMMKLCTVGHYEAIAVGN